MRYRILKWVVLFISIIFLIGGSLSFGTAVWAFYTKSEVMKQLIESSSAGVYLLVGATGLLILCGLVGIVAVIRRSQSILGSFIVLSSLTLILSLMGGVWTCVTASRAEDMSLERVTLIVRSDYGRDPSKTAILDIVQQSFECCGSDGFLSWSTSAYGRSQEDFSFTVPQSCCIDPSGTLCHRQRQKIAINTTAVDVNHFIFTKGCVNELQATSIPYGSYALCITLAAGVLQIIGIAVSVLLFQTFRYMDHSLP